MADQRRFLYAGGVEQGDDPVGLRFHRWQQPALGAAVAGQVDGQHGKAVVGEPAALQPQTLWSFSAPWMKTTVGSSGLKGLPPV